MQIMKKQQYCTYYIYNFLFIFLEYINITTEEDTHSIEIYLVDITAAYLFI